MMKMKDTANRKMASLACLQSSLFRGIFWTFKKVFCTKVICQALVFAASALFLLTGFKLTRLVSTKSPKHLSLTKTMTTSPPMVVKSKGISQRNALLFSFRNFFNVPRFCRFPAILFYVSQSCKLFSNCSMEVFGKTPDA